MGGAYLLDLAADNSSRIVLEVCHWSVCEFVRRVGVLDCSNTADPESSRRLPFTV